MDVPLDVAAAITAKKAMYGRFLDTKQWDKLQELVVLPDCEFLFLDQQKKPMLAGSKPLIYSNSAEFVKGLSGVMNMGDTQHLFGAGQFSFTTKNRDEVSAIWALQDTMIIRNTFGLVEVSGGGYYYETWKLVDGQWYMKSLRLERTFSRNSVIASLFALLGRFGLLPEV
ncbi:hypothetical protein ANO11243_010280 [Dothideomycetidae sp. 11243]|nr:hypothetical protein ANO11243_010280 [fungal sp. No.11243]